ncbi:MAG: minor capsid protein [Brachybacterium sp.]|uniref:minor capsid protein n=1 Tax=Brachybacterium sp. TaxID=1891286 RepID=UPI002649126A|nr:minor capsid protein [Brachybacterium sp.]MDN5687009.1 minor capsid protein [Brachybacterium sp.]
MDIEFTAGTNPGKTVEGAAQRGLALAAEYVLQQANQAVPIEEGTLQRSGRASVDDDGLRAAVSYDTPYAVAVHEDLTARHDEGRTAKWLEQAMNDSADQVGQIIAQAIRGEL